MQCPNCGHELSDDETLRFCPRCGRPVDDALSTPEEPALQSETPPAAPAAQPASFMSYVKHPLPWMGLVLYTLVGVTDAERTYPVLFASLVGWLSGAFTIWLYRRVVAAQREKKAHPAPKRETPVREKKPPRPKKQPVVLVRTFLVTEDTRRSGSSSLLRGAAGAVTFGAVGAAAGVLSGKNRHTTTFVLEYSDGHRETKTVKNGTKEYNKLCTLLERRI